MHPGSFSLASLPVISLNFATLRHHEFHPTRGYRLPDLHVCCVRGRALGGWLRQLALNMWLAHRRSISDQHAETSEGVTLPDTGERLDLDWALAHLSRDARMCVVLAYSEGMSHSEIRRATALPLGTVKAHIKRGAEQLRSLLSEYRAAETERHV